MRRWEVKISYENSVTTAVIQADSKDEAVDELLKQNHKFDIILEIEEVMPHVVYVDFIKKIKVA